MKAFFREIKRRKVIRVAGIYLVASWFLIQVGDVLFPALRLPDWSITMLVALMIVGFPVAMILSWVFDLKPDGIKRTQGAEAGSSGSGVSGRYLIIIMIAVLAAGLALFLAKDWILAGTDSSKVVGGNAPRPALLPLVIMMDSHHPSRVYDEDVLVSGGTNADVVSDILLDLPIRRQKEAVSPDWHRDQDILGFQPDLVIIHFSSFIHGHSEAPKKRLKLFIEFLAASETSFLIYSRWTDAGLRNSIDTQLADLEQQYPGLLARIHVFGLLDHGGRKWRYPAIQASLKLQVKSILEITE
jgi:hypothetical protein